jgi:putative secretion ATPase (PEP-CTERM system associated)
VYEKFYKLSGPPFKLTPDHRFFYRSAGHKKAMSYLQFGIHQGEGFIVITGNVGAGKSTLVRQLFAELDTSKVIASQIVTTQIEATGIVKLILSAFNLPIPNNDKASMLRSFETFLVQQYKQGKRVLLVVDEAQNLPLRTLEELRMLSNFVLDGQSLFQSFLLGQPQFNVLLADPQLEQLRQRVIASYHLESMSALETQEYIQHRLHRVGWTGKPMFTAEAYERVYAETEGIPRRINNLCNRVLLYGALEGLISINDTVVDEVVADHRREIAEGVALGEAVLSAAGQGHARASEARPNGSAEAAPRLDRIERHLEQHERAIQALLKTAMAILTSIRSADEQDRLSNGDERGSDS